MCRALIIKLCQQASNNYLKYITPSIFMIYSTLFRLDLIDTTLIFKLEINRNDLNDLNDNLGDLFERGWI